jgi:D-arabinose 1-dehydrogenase-like Zn-dependent alcohol dehydrogenase
MARFPGGDRHLITMRVIEISAFWLPKVLRLAESATPLVGPGDASIAVSASGISLPDVLQRKRLCPQPVGASDLPGLEVSGAIVLFTVRSDAKATACMAVGATHAINHRTDDFAEAVKRLTPGCGVDAVVLLTRRLAITGSTLRARSVAFNSVMAREVRAAARRWIGFSAVKPVVFTASQAAVAHAPMELNQHGAKLVPSW